jgi:ribosomal protein S18 acetylase RimI-like enzyme
MERPQNQHCTYGTSACAGFDARQSALGKRPEPLAKAADRGSLMPENTVLLMRRDLAGDIEAPVWPGGVVMQTLGEKPDRKLLQAVHAVLEPGYWEGGGGAPIFRQWWKALRRDNEFDPALVFIAHDDQGVAGLAQCWTSAFIKDLAVAPRMRRMGLGRALMLTTFETFVRRGANYVDLKVREDNAPAITLYKSLGMRTIERLHA